MLKKSVNSTRNKKAGMLLLAMFTAVFILFGQPLSYLAIQAEGTETLCQTTKSDNSDEPESAEYIGVPSYEATFPIFQNIQPTLGPVLWETHLSIPEIRWPQLIKPEPLVRFTRILFERIISPNAP